MPIPRWVTRSNKRFLNPVMLRVATGVGPMAVVRHVGRRSGRPYRTPVFAFAYRAPEDPGVRVVLALTYGPDVDWVRNVDAAGSFELERRDERYAVDDLRRVTGEDGLRLLPGWTSAVLRRTGVDEFRTGRLRRTLP
ncbi:nitroreductase family deazaflavin-dependent oxidoreductase [Cellulosimicrobium protaetiae]|uniref:Nitroreductase family deazaflavin-dependent oxidoreductase n=1 Tax=Cellulosimicrobium protaetiae TaxID=2587808 RepID=A0A6M5UG74_9MICO|nr:nitroreductase family deazaflavin-dependent oxidoreductase [Cellulosimicrobium protaetiae]QJW37150.1 nitroreductase family deazaflavin-dependent oxidoreductase [Cellulosimicrobium protaetiae]